MKSALVLGTVLLLLLAGYLVFIQQKPATTLKTSQQTSPQNSTNYDFSNPKKSAHYEANVPEHGSVLAGTPINVVINFNFDLAKPSEILVYSSGVKNPTSGTTSPVGIATGETIIDENRLSMRRAIDPKSPDDKYTVDYKACWPDGSCHDGSFQFAIDRAHSKTFDNQTGKKEVTINLSQTKFVPQNIKISKGTKVAWVNNDSVDHYVNTDPHPGHNYYPSQNSKLLKKGESYSLTFAQTGIYPYHCSTHASNMIGNLLVE